MNRNAILIILSVIVLSACQHTSPPTYSEPSTPQESANQAPQKPALVVNTPTQEVSEATYSVNLLDRIRAGFRFPQLHSKYTAEYEKWNASHPTYLNNLFTRSEPFLHYIVEEIEKRGLPMEIALLPAVESAYKPNAVSRSKAAGLWQFIPSTGKSFGLTQDWWYDGRRDVILSTNAALDYLTQLNKRFDGDWFLTLAAYNAGQGTVGRAIRKNKRKGKGTNYTSLSLRSETRRYVPKLIALKNIINNPSAFNVTLPVVANTKQFDVIELNGQVDLKKFAKQAGITPKALNNLNAGFLRWASAPNGPHRLLIPNDPVIIGNAYQAAQQTVKIDYQHHTIARGDTLSGIARRYGVSVSALKSTNNLKNNNIRAGKRLLVPFGGKAQASATQQSSKTKTNDKVIHKVKRGDTLWGIAKRYDVAVNQLLAWNKLSKNQILKLNQSLILFP